MFDVGWSELMVIAVVAVLVVGPKDLPRMLRAFGKTVGSMRKMAGDFQRQFDNAMREAELDEIAKQAGKPFAPLEEARKAALDFQRSMNASTSALEAEVKADPAPALTAPPALPALPASIAPQIAPAAAVSAKPVAVASKLQKPQNTMKTAIVAPGKAQVPVKPAGKSVAGKPAGNSVAGKPGAKNAAAGKKAVVSTGKKA